MYVPQIMPPITGTSFAQIAAEMGLTRSSRSRSTSSTRTATVPAQRSSRRRVGVATSKRHPACARPRETAPALVESRGRSGVESCVR